MCLGELKHCALTRNDEIPVRSNKPANHPAP